MATTTPPSSAQGQARTAPPADLRDALQAFLDGPNAETRTGGRGGLPQRENGPPRALPMEEHREQVLAWAEELASQGDTTIGFPEEFGGDSDYDRYIAGFE